MFSRCLLALHHCTSFSGYIDRYEMFECFLVCSDYVPMFIKLLGHNIERRIDLFVELDVAGMSWPSVPLVCGRYQMAECCNDDVLECQSWTGSFCNRQL